MRQSRAKKVKLIARLNPRWIDFAPEILAELVRDVSTLLDMTKGLLLHALPHGYKSGMQCSGSKSPLIEAVFLTPLRRNASNNLKILSASGLSNLSASHLQLHPRLAIRCVENGLNGFIEHTIEFSVRLLSRQPFNQRPGKTGDHAMIFAQTIVCFFPRIAARERNHSQDAGMFDKLGVEVVLLRQRKLEHDELTNRQFIDLLEDGCFE